MRLIQNVCFPNNLKKTTKAFYVKTIEQHLPGHLDCGLWVGSKHASHLVFPPLTASPFSLPLYPLQLSKVVGVFKNSKFNEIKAVCQLPKAPPGIHRY